MTVRVATIGFTRRSAASFFGALREARCRRLIDVRVANTSQLAGWAKRDDLAWFLGELCGMDYLHRPDLGPTPELLADWRKGRIDWPTYEERFVALMAERGVQDTVDASLLDGAVLLCSEPGPERCHRRLVLEYLAPHLPDPIEVTHL